LITPEYILTAAHCTQGSGATKVRVGGHKVSEFTSDSCVEERDATIINHPNYNPSTVENDISLLKLASPVSYKPIEHLDSSESPYSVIDGLSTTVLGWGSLQEGGSSPDTLQKVEVPIVSNTVCNQQYSGDITESMMCAGVENGGKDACQGDSGGPLVAYDDFGLPRLLGVVSWGIGCARKGFAGVYTRVSL